MGGFLKPLGDLVLAHESLEEPWNLIDITKDPTTAPLIRVAKAAGFKRLWFYRVEENSEVIMIGHGKSDSLREVHLMVPGRFEFKPIPEEMVDKFMSTMFSIVMQRMDLDCGGFRIVLYPEVRDKYLKWARVIGDKYPRKASKEYYYVCQGERITAVNIGFRGTWHLPIFDPIPAPGDAIRWGEAGILDIPLLHLEPLYGFNETPWQLDDITDDPAMELYAQDAIVDGFRRSWFYRVEESSEIIMVGVKDDAWEIHHITRNEDITSEISDIFIVTMLSIARQKHAHYCSVRVILKPEIRERYLRAIRVFAEKYQARRTKEYSVVHRCEKMNAIDIWTRWYHVESEV